MSLLPRPPGLGTGSSLVPGGAEFDATRPLVDLGDAPSLAARQGLARAKQRNDVPDVTLAPTGPLKQGADIPRGW